MKFSSGFNTALKRIKEKKAGQTHQALEIIPRGNSNPL